MQARGSPGYLLQCWEPARGRISAGWSIVPWSKRGCWRMGTYADFCPFSQAIWTLVKQCNCGLYGCLEHYISGTGLSNLCQHFLGTHLQAEQLLQRVAEKDPQALHVYQVFIDILCSGFASLQLTYEVDIIVLGGGLSNIKRLYADLEQRLPYFLFKGMRAVLLFLQNLVIAVGYAGLLYWEIDSVILNYPVIH